MKDVMAIIRQNMVNKTKRALSTAGISSFTATGSVLGRGKGLVDVKALAAAGEGSPEAIDLLSKGPRLYPKRLLTVVVPDDKVKTVVDTIIKTNQTGHPGDGKIFVLPLMEAVRVRTGEDGDAVLD
ncbi:MAG TPA: P-II family nitrogen regulator [Fibrobacteraceae bacterium]|nr:P-II family nitrogen regulator [Fibrobacteraceae bacterium]